MLLIKKWQLKDEKDKNITKERKFKVQNDFKDGKDDLLKMIIEGNVT